MNSNNSFRKSAIALAVVSATALSGGISSMAYAQQEDSALEEVTVTGSRIRRPDYIGNSPITSVSAEQITLTGTVNTESLLNTLPQVVPGLDRTSNNPGNGTATVDLRGLGSNRTLVLVNGRRASPTGGAGVVDINTIPNSLIESVEVVTGGASAVYGSDAIAGVVNFKLKDDFEGAQISAGYESTEEGDAEVFSADVTIGGNFAEDRGNAVINFSHTDRSDLFQGDRDFATFAQFEGEDDAGNPILIDGGSSGVPATSIFAGGFGGFSPDSFGVIFNQDGSLRPFRTTGDNDFYNYAPVNYIQLPQERNQITALLSYDLTDSTTAYSDFFFTKSDVPQQLAPTPIFETTTFTVDGNPFITPDAQRILSNAIGDGVDANGNGIDDTATALLRRRLEEVGPRVAQSDFTSYTIVAGLRGEIGNTDWNYDAYYQQGNSTLQLTQLGNVNRGRFSQALLLNGAGGCSDGGTNGSTVACAPLNIFGEGNISPQAAAFLRTAVTAIGELDQDVLALSVDGSIGAVGLAGGVEYRDSEFDFRPSQDLAAGTIAGFNSQPPSGGSFNVTEVYGEALIPLVKDASFAKSIELELAARHSDYSTIGGISTFKAAGSWEVNDSLRFRGGYNVAIRAPGITELFAPASEGFPGANDPCSASGGPVSAEVAAICAATGVPANVIGSPAINPAAGQVRAVGGGNPNLEEEEATTFTIGAVFNPIESVTASIDYFNIEIEDYIATFGGGASNILQTCYDPTDPAGGVGSDFCNAVNRRGDGTINFVATSAQNVAEQTLKGIDLSVRYSTDLFGGTGTVNYIGTVTNESDFTPFTGADTTDCAGKFGNNICGEPLPEYKHRVSFAWAGDKLNTQLLWRHVGSTDDDDDDTLYAVESLGSENYFDFSGSYSFNDNYDLTFGIDNLFDKEPPILGENAEQANTYPATYDVFGRTYFLKMTAKF